MTVSRVVVSMRVPASPERAFDLFTSEIGDWWVDSPLFRFTPRSPGRLEFEAPADDGAPGRLVEKLASGRVFEIGQVSTWVRGERLELSWRMASFGPELETRVAITFEAAGDDTRVTVIHSGWNQAPQTHVARHGFPLADFQKRQAEQWREGLARLAAQCTRKRDD